MKYEQLQSLEEFLTDVEAALLSEEARTPVKYSPHNIAPWNAAQIDAENQGLLNSVSGAANVYAIFTAPKNTNEFTLRYIGKTTKKLARQRIRNHLITKNEKTGAKLWKIISHVQAGGAVKISWVSVEPESLRNYIEEELINLHKGADWNRENA
ncbi:GIY-YIG nuclease family protein [Aromatoleum petrolei]|uniref:GIY-YIG domain-containing protein n=1 Tax=Aromatoleum petrolei TaxID=76116 RepID=A0ABX1MSQ4_9RHOO|nr:GIY-YIG nuclease family protein [Aromatoleum petrolei]NMF90997.1 hypothetical protein [Aromatoleum petrolei]QTQ36754.1 Uncharacterized protein ToN1_26140 [Aromatoleum petrolei]